MVMMLFRGRAARYIGAVQRAWVLLIIAGVLETVWAVGLKYSHGFSRPLPTVITVAAMGGSMWLLALAMKALPVGTAYAVWTGIGAVGAALFGILLLGESREAGRIVSLALIVAGIIGLKLTARG
jgi:quaternary ammonium compound-resistance protein SugE